MPEFLSEFVRFLFAAGLVLGGGLWLFSGWQRYVQPQQWIQLLHHAPSGVLLVGEDRVLRANLAAYLLLGIRLVGRHYLFLPSRVKRVSKLLSSARQQCTAKALRPSALACAGQFDPNSRDLSFALTSLAEEIMASECDWF